MHRFEGKFEYTFETDENINQHKMMIPPMLLQPFIENAINHGILHKQSGTGTITICFEKLKNSICCSVTDNGIGRAAAKELKNAFQSDHESTSTIITEQRIQLLKDASQKMYDFSIIDLVDETGAIIGTKVVVEIPILIQ
jgi:sensor histidine kinase YesM